MEQSTSHTLAYCLAEYTLLGKAVTIAYCLAEYALLGKAVAASDECQHDWSTANFWFALAMCFV